MYDVIRNFGVDYIFFDLAFLVTFIILLIKKKKTLPLIALFVGGLLINLLVDWGYWLHTGIRQISLPANFFGGVFLFFVWFSLTYGVEYAYVFLMFQKKTNKFLWTYFIFTGWLLVGLLSQLLSINDSAITVTRHMSSFRLPMLGILIFGYGLLFFLKYKPKQILYLFFVGFMIHFMMEFSLFVTGIRPGNLLILIENSLIEFNMGVPFFYILYDKFLKKKFKT